MSNIKVVDRAPINATPSSIQQQHQQSRALWQSRRREARSGSGHTRRQTIYELPKPAGWGEESLASEADEGNIGDSITDEYHTL